MSHQVFVVAIPRPWVPARPFGANVQWLKGMFLPGDVNALAGMRPGTEAGPYAKTHCRGSVKWGIWPFQHGFIVLRLRRNRIVNTP